MEDNVLLNNTGLIYMIYMLHAFSACIPPVNVYTPNIHWLFLAFCCL